LIEKGVRRWGGGGGAEKNYVKNKKLKDLKIRCTVNI
jgi:hypothetical protein